MIVATLSFLFGDTSGIGAIFLGTVAVFMLVADNV